MTEERLMSVHTEVVKDVLVARILGAVLDREPPRTAEAVMAALRAPLDLPVCDGGPLDLRMRGIGYLTRIVEAEMFEPARRPLDGLGDELEGRIGGGAEWTDAVAALCRGFAREETLPRPAPDDVGAVSWRVPGPGGHVRHFVVAAAIAEVLSERPGTALPGVTDAGELKRCWTYGFMVRCCEEACPPVRTHVVDLTGR
jgi:hypothetical protein